MSVTNMQEDPVRVVVRVRPLLPNEKLHHHEPCVRLVSSSNQIIVGKDRAFTFDHVLSSKISQEAVYSVCVEGLVYSFFEGYNVTVFAYGQTGAGKTFTVGGHNSVNLTEEEIGLIPRAVNHIFNEVKERHNRDFILRASYIEVYKEELRDLLDWETSSKDMHIREDEKGNTVILGAKEIICENVDEVLHCLDLGSTHRHTGATNMNELSSRSHSIFTLMLEQKWAEPHVGDEKVETNDDDLDEEVDQRETQVLSAKFHFVDLAGSERAHKTGNEGERFKESVHINSGLLSLGNVISALGDPKRKATHIPYRDSKITRILKDSLGGNAKTCMITCISPSAINFDETLNSLKYANRARNIRNKPIVNHDHQSSQLAAMQTEIQALREELQRHQLGTALTHRSEFSENASELQSKIKRLQMQNAHYSVCIEETMKVLTVIQDLEGVPDTLMASVKNCFDLAAEIRDEVGEVDDGEETDNQRVATLKTKLKKALNDLASDEEIFAEKSRENAELKTEVNKMRKLYSDVSEKFAAAEQCIKQQESRLIEQQTKLEELQASISQLQNAETNGTPGSPLASPGRRALSAPIHHSALRPKSAIVGGFQTHRDRPKSRQLHTSPPLFSIERIVQGFRARSHVLIRQLEDSDEVLLQDVDDTEEVEGGQSKLGQTFERKQERVNNRRQDFAEKKGMGGTVTLTKGPSQANTPRIDNPEVNKLRTSVGVNQERIKDSQQKVRQSHSKLKDLTLNVRLKEELIRELVKTGKESEAMNKKYASRIRHLEEDGNVAHQELYEVQKALHHLESKELHGTQENKKKIVEYKKKMMQAEKKVKELERQQQEMQKVVKIQTTSEKRVAELEIAIGRMKQHMELTQLRLKEESERKAKLERDLQRDQQKMKEMEIRNDQQQKVLKRKTEEVVAVKRKLRHGSTGSQSSEEQDRLEEQKKWLDAEVEKVLEKKRHMEDLQQELVERTRILDKKEAMMKEKGVLEIKKLRSSQTLSKDILGLSARLIGIEKQLDDKTNILKASVGDKLSKIKEEIKSCQIERERLTRQRKTLEEKLEVGTLLSAGEERKLLALDEGIEALDAAIEFKNDVISSRQQALKKTTLTQSQEAVVGRLNTLSKEDTRDLLSKYFEKVINLKEIERKKDLELSDLEIKVDEQTRLIKELEGTLQRARIEMERRLVEQEKEHEKQVQIVLRQMGEGSFSESSSKNSKLLDQKVQELEKDLYYYKKTSRELKKKLREVVASSASSMGSQIKGSTDGNDRPESAISARGDLRNPPRSETARTFTPVRKTKKEIRELSVEEISLRRSNASQSGLSLDSVEASSNPWN